MTDRPNPSRPAPAETGGDAVSRVEEKETRSETSRADAARRQFLRKLNHQEHVLNRAVREIDGVADQIRRVAATDAGDKGNWSISPAGSGVAARPIQAAVAASGVAPVCAAAAAPMGIAEAVTPQAPQTATPPAGAAEAGNFMQRPWPPKTEPVARVEIQPAPRDEAPGERRPMQEERRPEPRIEKPAEKPVVWPTAEMKERYSPSGMVVIEADRGPIKAEARSPDKGGGSSDGKGGGGGGGGGVFHKRLGPVDFSASLRAGIKAIRQNLMIVMVFTIATNVLVLAIPVYLFQISDRVLTSRSIDTLMMLTALIVGAVVLQTVFDGIRRMILMRTAVEVAAQLGAPILSAAARAALHSNGREYQTLGDLQQLRSFLVSGTLLSFLDAPIAPFFLVAVFLIHPHLGAIVVTSAVLLLIVTLLNQRATAAGFGEATNYQTKANLHLDSMSRNSQIINALAMIPEAVHIWGKDMAGSLKAQVLAQDRNIAFASLSKAVRLLTQVTMLGWGANLALHGHLTGGMVISASIIAGRALGPIEAAIEGWHQVIQARAAYGRITSLLQTSPLNFERLKLPRPEGRLDVERLLFVPQGTKRVVLNGITFALEPGDSLAVIGSSGAGKTTLGKMLVGSILPTSGNVRLDLMDLRNWDQRQFGESIGYLPQDVQLFPGTIKANIARMREDATDADIYAAAKLADVHDMIATLPHGYETVVAADGSPLSGGQKQRVALARAFFGNPRMVVLDEPNSNLDTAGEAALTRALSHAKREKITVVTITQRPALLNSVDKVLLLVNGTVALFGMRQDVLKALASRGVNTEGNPLEQNQLP
ncbi:type I secretion system permease/ATPase (plasmid) [Ensifer sp. PDNC004]|uniref:type I secretion system permease/ATPase n=1 Tax=Ensifer sp. PDNC004 TaxID=2811423 RepID=UPI001965A635|nr:type I secretion system permease/ATPase [Ensifer sp. PDNC004]QRY64890.1 type I secretion system permease/ATPase [Ensifer sp. PDNC004]